MKEPVKPWWDAPPGVPPGGEIQWHEMRDGARIRVGVWHRPSARGTVLVLPGRTEFIEKYGETVGDLLDRGFCVVVIDWRGQGLSTRPLDNPLKGHIDTFRTYVDDFREIMSGVREHLPAPYILLCHSMGGNIGARILVDDPSDIAAAIFTGPMLGLNTGSLPGYAVRSLGMLSNALKLNERYIPGAKEASALDERFEDNVVTGDAIRFARNNKYIADKPELGLGPPTVGWVRAAFHSIDHLARRGVAEAVPVPALFVVAGQEALTDNAAAQRFARRMKRSQVLELSQAKHEILQEQDEIREEFWTAFDAFIAQVLKDEK